MYQTPFEILVSSISIPRSSSLWRSSRKTIGIFRAVLDLFPEWRCRRVLPQVARPEPGCEQAPSLREPCFHERPMIDRLEALFHPEMRRKLGGWDHTAMRDFEAWLPRHQLDFRSSAAGLLQTKGLIHYARGRIILLNPEGLEVFSCERYRILSRAVNSLLPPDNRSARDFGGS